VKDREEIGPVSNDIMQFLMNKSEFINKRENRWIKPVIEIVRSTSLFFQPQIRTKIMNEGWASYWHEKLFLSDDRIGGHETDFARCHAWVTSMPRAGLNPYALGMRIFQHIDDWENKGRFSEEYRRLDDQALRERFDLKTGNGSRKIFDVREQLDDAQFVRTYLDRDFVVKNRLFIVGKRHNPMKGVYEYYVKSRDPDKYREMILDGLYHPPKVRFFGGKDGELVIEHIFEGYPLYEEFIGPVLKGLNYLWGKNIILETHMPHFKKKEKTHPLQEDDYEITWQKTVYKAEDGKVIKKVV
jgi:stage V sporulation protein R